MNIGEDVSDAFLAIIQGDTAKLSDVLGRTGDDAAPDTFDAGTAGEAVAGGVIGAAAAAVAASGTKSIATAAEVLGNKAKGYRWAATGPDYYDCSGLMYRACQKVGYKGGRFTTFTIGTNKAFKKVGSPAANSHDSEARGAAGINDLVVWPTHHMGVITGPNRFYSARNPKSGISEASISTFRSEAPVYYRFVG